MIKKLHYTKESTTSKNKMQCPSSSLKPGGDVHGTTTSQPCPVYGTSLRQTSTCGPHHVVEGHELPNSSWQHSKGGSVHCTLCKEEMSSRTSAVFRPGVLGLSSFHLSWVSRNHWWHPGLQLTPFPFCGCLQLPWRGCRSPWNEKNDHLDGHVLVKWLEQSPHCLLGHHHWKPWPHHHHTNAMNEQPA